MITNKSNECPNKNREDQTKAKTNIGSGNSTEEITYPGCGDKNHTS